MNNLQENIEEGIKIQDLLQICLSKWKWFVLSVICTMVIAYFYIKTTPPTYVRTASVLIKEDGQSSSDILSEYGIFQNNANVNNEIITFQALPQMEGVVRRLALNMNYVMEGRFHDVVLYGTTLPVKAVVNTPEEDLSASFTLHLLDNRRVQLSDFVLSEDEFEVSPLTVALGEKVKTPVGEVLIEATDYYTDSIKAPIFVSKSSIAASTRAYAAGLGAALHEKECTVVDLSFSDVSPQRAEDVLNTLIEVYNENWVKSRNLVAQSTSVFISNRLAVVEKELGLVEEDISAFKSKTLMPDIKRASELFLTKSEATDKELQELYNRLAITRYLQEYMVSNSSKTQFLPANSGIESGGIESQISEYNRMILQRNNYVAGSSEENPLVQDLDKSIVAMHKAILASVNNYIVTLNTQIESLEKIERKTNSQLAASPTQAKYLLSIERQQKVKEQLYLFLLQKREENELTQTFAAYNTKIIQPAVGSSLPSSPAKSRIMLIAFVLGLIIPAGIIFLLENMNTKIRTRQDLKNLTVPFLGEIPLNVVPKKRFGIFKKEENQEHGKVVVRDRQRNVINEAFRVLRTNLEFVVGKGNSSQIILLTSFIPGSGKTFLTANLGACLAIRGKRVLTIDGDLRKGSMSKYINSPRLGLSDYLTGAVDDVSKIIYPVEGMESYEMIPIGTMPPNPTELLEDARLEVLLKELRKSYDYIFIDCPPIECVADSQVLEQYADRTLFAVRSGLLEREMLPTLETLYVEKKYKNLCVILNGVHSYGTKYGYGYAHKHRHKFQGGEKF